MTRGRHLGPGTGNEGRLDRRLLLLVASSVVAIGAVLGLAVVRAEDGAVEVSVSAPVTTGDTAGAPSTGEPAVPASPVTRPAKPPKGSTSISLAFAGDLLPHMAVNDQARAYGAESGAAYDFGPMLAPMKSIISGADVAICHMEVPLAPPGEAISSYPAFGAPPELVDAVKSVGYDGCSNSSNHSLDRGRAGIAATLDRFDRNGLRHAGTARTAEEGDSITVYDVKGVKVAHLSYAYDFNGYKVPADAPWAVDQIDPARIKADAGAARAAGANLVVVSLHWGTEYDSAPSQYQRDVAAQILPSADIDLVIGCHAHVVQPIEQVGGTYVVWGMGNQLSNMTQAPRRDGITVRATAAVDANGRWKVSGVEAIPTWVDLGSFRVLPVVDALADRKTPATLRAELSGSYDRSAAIVTGVKTPGVTLAAKP